MGYCAMWVFGLVLASLSFLLWCGLDWAGLGWGLTIAEGSVGKVFILSSLDVPKKKKRVFHGRSLG